MAKPRKDYQAYVRLNALVGFSVRGENPEDALERAREELKTIKLLNEGIEYLDGTETLTGVLEND